VLCRDIKESWAAPRSCCVSDGISAGVPWTEPAGDRALDRQVRDGAAEPE